MGAGEGGSGERAALVQRQIKVFVGLRSGVFKALIIIDGLGENNKILYYFPHKQR